MLSIYMRDLNNKFGRLKFVKKPRIISMRFSDISMI